MTVVDRGISSKTLDFGGCCEQFLHLRAVETWPALQRHPARLHLLQGTAPLACKRPACMLRGDIVPDDEITVVPDMLQHRVRAIKIPERALDHALDVRWRQPVDPRRLHLHEVGKPFAGVRVRDQGIVPMVWQPIGNRLCRERSEEHTSELQSLMRISYAVFCLKKKKKQNNET